MTDDWFSDDPFDSIFREFFGEHEPKRRRVYREEDVIEGEEEDRVIDFVETEDKIYFVFEMPGYDEKDITIMTKDKKIEINAQKKDTENVLDYLAKKLAKGIKIKKTLPFPVNNKSLKSTCKNGILEVSFDKK